MTTGSSGATARTATSARLLKLFTELPLDEIARLAALQGAGAERGQEGARHRGDRPVARPRRRRPGRRNRAPHLRGRRARRNRCRRSRSRAPNSRPASACSPPSSELALSSSNGEARRQIKGGGLKVNDVDRHRREAGAHAARPHAGRRDQALARQEAARVAEAGMSGRVENGRQTQNANPLSSVYRLGSA